jgi:PAS domain-containing protein
MATAGNICCPPLWIGFGLRVSGSRFGADVLYYGLPQPFTAFALSAIASTFWYGGTEPGILAALISWLVRDYFFEPEVSAESRILYGLAFLVFALVMTLVMRGRNELEARVAERTAELTKANEDLTLAIARQDELRAIIDNAPVFVWSDLPDGYCDFLNQRWLTYSYYPMGLSKISNHAVVICSRRTVNLSRSSVRTSM